jgi:hypothetical protein
MKTTDAQLISLLTATRELSARWRRRALACRILATHYRRSRRVPISGLSVQGHVEYFWKALEEEMPPTLLSRELGRPPGGK